MDKMPPSEGGAAGSIPAGSTVILYTMQTTRTDIFLFCIGAVLVLFFSSYRLFASPEPWLDEGLIIQSAQGLLETGKAALPTAPGVWEPAWYITTGFPVTAPLAGMFAVFGTSLESARVVMFIFLICFYSMLWLYMRRAVGGTAAWLGFFLLIFFAPIYGHGRNVLGEVPGLLCILTSLLPLIQGRPLSRKGALWIGIFAGLAVATKPIFVLFLPALLLGLLLHKRELALTKVFFFGALGVAVPLLVWAVTQFDHTTIVRVFSVYANPHEVTVWQAIMTNIQRLGTEMQPLYFFLALGAWTTSYGVRRWRKEPVAPSEEILLFFSLLVCVAYLRTVGYYRYFFPAQVFALLYVPQSLWYLFCRNSLIRSRGVIVGIFLLIAFQAHETVYNSWVATHYNSTRTQVLTDYFATPTDVPIFLYQTPEVFPFLNNRPAYQYVHITPSINPGEEYISLLRSGLVEHVITPRDVFIEHQSDLFYHYTQLEQLDSYVILTTRNTPTQ